MATYIIESSSDFEPIIEFINTKLNEINQNTNLKFTAKSIDTRKLVIILNNNYYFKTIDIAQIIIDLSMPKFEDDIKNICNETNISEKDLIDALEVFYTSEFINELKLTLYKHYPTGFYEDLEWFTEEEFTKAECIRKSI